MSYQKVSVENIKEAEQYEKRLNRIQKIADDMDFDKLQPNMFAGKSAEQIQKV
jgi:hypothetical protein